MMIAFSSRVIFLNFLKTFLMSFFDDSMSDSFCDDDSSNLNTFCFRANANFTFDRWDKNLWIVRDENQWISIWLSSLNNFFDDYVDYFIVEDFNMSEDSMNVNFSIALFDSSN